MLNSSQSILSPSNLYDVLVNFSSPSDPLYFNFNNNNNSYQLFSEEKCLNETIPMMSPIIKIDFSNSNMFMDSPPTMSLGAENVFEPTGRGVDQEDFLFDNSGEELVDIYSIAGDLFDEGKVSEENEMQSEFLMTTPQTEKTDLTEIDDILKESMKMWSDGGTGDLQLSNFPNLVMEESINSNPLLQWPLCDKLYPEAVTVENMNVEKGERLSKCDPPPPSPQQHRGKINKSRKMTRKPSSPHMSTSSSNSSITSLNKNNPQYVEKRERNNESVRRSRDKSRRKQMETMEKVKVLTEENEMLNNKVNDLLKELDILKGLFTNISKK